MQKLLEACITVKVWWLLKSNYFCKLVFRAAFRVLFLLFLFVVVFKFTKRVVLIWSEQWFPLMMLTRVRLLYGLWNCCWILSVLSIELPPFYDARDVNICFLWTLLTWHVFTCSSLTTINLAINCYYGRLLWIHKFTGIVYRNIIVVTKRTSFRMILWLSSNNRDRRVLDSCLSQTSYHLWPVPEIIMTSTTITIRAWK